MNKIILFIVVFVVAVLGQQINHTWGYTTAGASYYQTGVADLDSLGTIDIVFDMQDYYPYDYNPLALGDSSDDVINNSNLQFLGTFWYRIDAEEAADSIGYAIKAYPGNLVYYSGSGQRITATNINFSTTATTLIDTSATRQVDDVQWSWLNVYVNSSQNAASTVQRHLPPEFVKLNILFTKQTEADLDFFWVFAYPAVTESEQSKRSTLRGDARKAKESLH